MTITLPYPPSANVYWRSVGQKVLKSKEARTYQAQAGWLVRAAGVDITDAPVAVTLRFYRPRKSGDLDNRIKPLLDALNGIAYKDDDQIVEIHAYRYDDKENPRVEIEVVQIGEHNNKAQDGPSLPAACRGDWN